MRRAPAAPSIAAILAGRAAAETPGPTPGLSLVLDRGERAVELYLAGPAPRLLSLFGGYEAVAPEAIDPDRWRVAGCFDFADALFAGTEARVGGAPVRFEAMSAMLHPEGDPLPLLPPLDGLIAIAVCTAPVS